jgi:hypothetical protein
VLVNNRTYGGGGIFNLYSTVASDNAFANYVFVHEFGHHFAGLADEYYTSSVAYAAAADRVEPWEPNVTALLDVSALKWRNLASPFANVTPIPTPWNKEEFENYSREIQKRRAQLRKDKRPEEEMEALFKEELAHEQKMFKAEKHFGQVGAFEGAMYEARVTTGLRSTASCFRAPTTSASLPRRNRAHQDVSRCIPRMNADFSGASKAR